MLQKIILLGLLLSSVLYATDATTLILGEMRQIRQEIKQLREDMNKRFEQVDKRFEQVDKRFEQVDKRFEDMNSRFENIYMLLVVLIGVMPFSIYFLLQKSEKRYQAFAKQENDQREHRYQELADKLKALIFALKQRATKDEDLAKDLKVAGLL